MIIKGKYLDEILRKLYSSLSNSTDTFKATKGKGKDILSPKLVLTNPRARVSSTATRGVLISALAEFCWYMSGSADLDFIRFYIQGYPPKEKTGLLREAYGPRLVGSGEFYKNVNQIDRIIKILSRKPDSRRAVITVLEIDDLDEGRDEVPCTTTLQFIHRRGHLHMVASMRSNDAYLGLPHDVFCFTMIQEYIARSLGFKMGEYHHSSTSLHLYEVDEKKVTNYIDEGYQNPKFSMPVMPKACQKKNLQRFLEVEEQIRNGSISNASQIDLPIYWRDLSLVLLRHADSKFKRGTRKLSDNFSNISHDFYNSFFRKQPKSKQKISETQKTQDIFELEVTDV